MRQLKSILATLEVDLRLIGMIAALAVIWGVFHAVTGGLYVTPRNIFNLSVQTASVAVMATGMVFVIVTRHIDLSVGALLGFIGMTMGMIQAKILPEFLGYGHPMIWVITVFAGLLMGAVFGAFQGWLIGYLTIPAFIVTLGGLLAWRGAAWWVTEGQTVAPLDETFKVLGGAGGTLGIFWSWVVGILASLAAVALVFQSRRRKVAHEFHVKPLWAEFALAGIYVGVICSFVAVLNAYEVPTRRIERMFEAKGEVMPEGLTMGYGLPISVLVLLAVTVVMTIVAQRTRLGRYIFATGGNPDAAELSGIDTKFLTVKVFAIMGGLVAIGAVIASARLGSAANDLGTLDELRVIAAAVIGGTALSGGVGTIYGAVLGALIMQSLQSGMAMVGVDAPLQSIVVGVVLVFAVWIDIVYRRRTGS
ncbi:sugar ABC transporter permease [Actibacterium lipolyticum]|uniref:Xylose transport system permease protein XylH n=1 Tax=Actibacterium lipolyticum TaxID=1524263 RepID=A0A238KPN2_9RHOB|nr:sugar ABC transporter permease [Actibacterium lipolyticum]SMX44824.1 Xylose transport system permease protein XylH [Actibacterium lipolyticum]